MKPFCSFGLWVSSNLIDDWGLNQWFLATEWRFRLLSLFIDFGIMNGFRDVSSSSGSVMIGDDDNAALSSEDSSCPDESVSETELDLALGLSIGLKGRRKVRSSLQSLSSSSSSLTRESGTKRSADSSAVASNATR